MTNIRPFKQVDVFTSTAFNGNPLAVILDAKDLSTEQMQAIARWTNLSETTFVLPATDPTADYRVRIFTPDLELPFAGHPTLGTAHALLEAGLTAKQPKQLIQQCEVGLVKIRMEEDGALAFASPSATLTPFSSPRLAHALGCDQLASQQPVMIADMGIRWLLVPMQSVEAVLSVKPDAVEFAHLLQQANINGVMPFGPLENMANGYEVRGLLIEQGSLTEDPVTGSANACLARYFQSLGREQNYQAHQGTAIQRAGRLHITYHGDDVWVGGQTVTILDGTIRL